MSGAGSTLLFCNNLKSLKKNRACVYKIITLVNFVMYTAAALNITFVCLNKTKEKEDGVTSGEVKMSTAGSRRLDAGDSLPSLSFLLLN